MRALVLAAAGGELTVDKLPATPSRLEARGLGARVASAAVCGRAMAGPQGAAVAIAAAMAAAVAGAGYRTQLARRLGRGPVWAVLEDGLAVGARRHGDGPRRLSAPGRAIPVSSRRR